VRFITFGASSLDVEIFAYIFARDWPQFLEIQQELLLDIMENVQRAGASMALPSQTVYLARSSKAPERGRRRVGLWPQRGGERRALAENESVAGDGVGKP
jgi:MscS family membrane protein